MWFHAMPRLRPLQSIRGRLLGLLLIALAGTWLAIAFLTYRDTHRGIDTLLDAHLQQAAHLLVTQAGHELDEGRDLEEVELEEDEEPSPYRTAVAFQVRRADDGALLLRSANAPNAPLAGATKGFSDSITGGTHWRVYTAADQEHELVFHVAENHAAREAIARKVAWRTLAPLLVALPLFGMLVWWVVGRALRPLERLADELAGRSPTDLRPVRAGPLPLELVGLVDRLDALLQRIRDSLDSERRFTSHAAHELRTPVAAMRAQTEVALGTDDAAVRDAALRQSLLACDRMSRLVTQLLVLARADDAATLPASSPCRLDVLAEQVLADVASDEMADGVNLSLDAPASVGVEGDPALLEALIRNLAENAIRHGGPGANVRVAVANEHGRAMLTVEDDGPGVSPEVLDQLGRRFFRGPETRVSGTGLGLSIVLRIAELHRGSVRFSSGDGGRGFKAEVTLPQVG
ncbi:MAG: two-component sensor histidine kinase [Gammaproteobacteria bacterium]|nr:two-component sensor histidine kinase [Gammaproteobacteria bacterium]